MAAQTRNPSEGLRPRKGLNDSTDHPCHRLAWQGASSTMNQISFSDAEYAGKRTKTRREVFLAKRHRSDLNSASSHLGGSDALAFARCSDLS